MTPQTIVGSTDIEAADRADAEARAARRAPKPKLGAAATAAIAFLVASAFGITLRMTGLQHHALEAALPIAAITISLYVFQRLAWARYRRTCDDEYAKILDERAK